MPVTVTYPDGTQDHVTVPVTTNPEKDVIAPDAPTINQPSVGDKTISGKVNQDLQ